MVDLLTTAPTERIVVELTEHAPIESYEAVNLALLELRALGIRFAVDDAGAGFASLRHILRLSPDLIKLDRSLTSDIDTDDARRALASALILFAHEIGSSVVASPRPIRRGNRASAKMSTIPSSCTVVLALLASVLDSSRAAGRLVMRAIDRSEVAVRTCRVGI